MFSLHYETILWALGVYGANDVLRFERVHGKVGAGVAASATGAAAEQIDPQTSSATGHRADGSTRRRACAQHPNAAAACSPCAAESCFASGRSGCRDAVSSDQSRG